MHIHHDESPVPKAAFLETKGTKAGDAQAEPAVWLSCRSCVYCATGSALCQDRCMQVLQTRARSLPLPRRQGIGRGGCSCRGHAGEAGPCGMGVGQWAGQQPVGLRRLAGWAATNMGVCRVAPRQRTSLSTLLHPLLEYEKKGLGPCGIWSPDFGLSETPSHRPPPPKYTEVNIP